MRQERHWKEEEENCEVEWEPRPQLLGTAGCQHLYERGKKIKVLAMVQSTGAVLVFNFVSHSSHRSGPCSLHVHRKTSPQAGMRGDRGRACCQLGSVALGCTEWHSEGCGHKSTCMCDLLGWRGTSAHSSHCFLCMG